MVTKKKRVTLKQKLANAARARIRRLSQMSSELAIQHLEDVRAFLEEDMHTVSHDEKTEMSDLVRDIDDLLEKHFRSSNDEEVE